MLNGLFEFYKITDPYNVQYSSGLKNGYIQKTKKGKTWNSIGALKSHLSATERFDKKAFELFYDDWVVLKITENGIANIGTVKDFR